MSSVQVSVRLAAIDTSLYGVIYSHQSPSDIWSNNLSALTYPQQPFYPSLRGFCGRYMFCQALPSRTRRVWIRYCKEDKTLGSICMETRMMTMTSCGLFCSYYRRPAKGFSRFYRWPMPVANVRRRSALRIKITFWGFSQPTPQLQDCCRDLSGFQWYACLHIVLS